VYKLLKFRIMLLLNMSLMCRVGWGGCGNGCVVGSGAQQLAFMTAFLLSSVQTSSKETICIGEHNFAHKEFVWWKTNKKTKVDRASTSCI
jgi:hypothetical protein